VAVSCLPPFERRSSELQGLERCIRSDRLSLLGLDVLHKAGHELPRSDQWDAQAREVYIGTLERLEGDARRRVKRGGPIDPEQEIEALQVAYEIYCREG
jgi:hypothetical protein